MVTFGRSKVGDDHTVRVSGDVVRLLLDAWRRVPKSLNQSKPRPVDTGNVANLDGACPDRQRAVREWVFTTHLGTRWSLNVRREFKETAVRAGLLVSELPMKPGQRKPRFDSALTIHDMRRTVDSWGDAQGWHDSITCQITGHDAAVKKRSYSRAFDDTLWACANSLGTIHRAG